MDTRLKQLTRERKIKEWSFHIQECRKSGGNVLKYCTEHHLTKSMYYYWQKIIFEKLSDEVHAGSFNSETQLSTTTSEYLEHNTHYPTEISLAENNRSSNASKTQFVELNMDSTYSDAKEVLAATFVVGKTSVNVYNSINPELLQIIMKGLRQC